MVKHGVLVGCTLVFIIYATTTWAQEDIKPSVFATTITPDPKYMPLM
jgi:hypothetical protein